MSEPTKRDCAGCHNDFYNHNRMGLNEEGGEPKCWSLKDATFVKAMDVPTNQPPPYKLPLTKRPSCYKAQGYVRVKPENLTKEGFWK